MQGYFLAFCEIIRNKNKERSDRTMSIKKYRLCLIGILVAVLLLGVVVMVQSAEEEGTYTDGIMVYNECVINEEEYL